MRSGPQTFEDPRAVAVATAVVTKLMEYAQSMQSTDLSLLRPGEVSDVIVLPALELVNIICMFTGAAPPKPYEVAELKEHHLALLRRFAPALYGAELGARRCAEAEWLFAKLLLISHGYWRPPGSAPPN
ncbi:MAG: hypothetical protein U1A78_32115 [Polyangia bacterium]